ncbi:MAG: hypothetical protein CMJ18_09620 [Phycisphaeraceae bacterium]|nr:hypothetical protein [Phycisphaeraceae bacterium]
MSEHEKPGKSCLACGRDDGETPLINLQYRGESIWICPQHLPVLIHDPARLIGTLPGAENLRPADHHD